MSTTYYNFLSPDKASSHLDAIASNNSIDAQRQANNSPDLFATSPSDSSSSLNQFNSSTPTSTTSSSIAYSSSDTTVSSASSTGVSLTGMTPQPQEEQQQPIPSTNISLMNKSGNNISQIHRDLQRQSSITPTMHLSSYHCQQHTLSHSYTLHSLEPRPLKPFKSRSAYIEAMKEDLSEWLNRLYSDLELTVDNFFSLLETGAIICRHANNVTQMGRNSMLEQVASESNSGGNSSNDNSLTHEAGRHHQEASLSSPSPDCDDQHRDIHHQPLSLRHRHSTTNSSISSIATNSSSASRQRLSLTGTNYVISPARNERPIDWFRVKMIPYKVDARAGTFFARDNICQFILWCRSLRIRDCLLFETDDLVARKNEKSFILCLLEVARIGFKVGMPTPLIIQLEQEIDREIERDAKLQRQIDEEQTRQFKRLSIADDMSSGNFMEQVRNNDNNNNESLRANDDTEVGDKWPSKTTNDVADEEECEQDYGPKPQVITNDLLSLHEKVVQLLCQCTCATQFPMVRIGDGKYRVGDKLVIFVRILRRHIMVRVGGGWQELSEFLRQKDPCRSKNNFHSSVNPTINHLDHSCNSTPYSSLVTTTTTNNSTTMPNNQIPTTKIPTLTGATRSRFISSNHHLNRNHQRNVGQKKLISSSVSMSRLSHN